MIFTWLAGLGLAAKIGAGVTAAAVAGVGAGAAGILPPVAQDAFDRVTSSITQTDEDQPAEQPVIPEEIEDNDELETETVEGSEPVVPGEGDEGEGDRIRERNHGDAVSEVAENGTGGREHGEAVRDVAGQNDQERPEQADQRPEHAPQGRPAQPEQRPGPPEQRPAAPEQRPAAPESAPAEPEQAPAEPEQRGGQPDQLP